MGMTLKKKPAKLTVLQIQLQDAVWSYLKQCLKIVFNCRLIYYYDTKIII